MLAAGILYSLLLGQTIITAPTGHFDYENYSSLENVVEGTVISCKEVRSAHLWQSRNLVAIRVSRVWTGESAPGDTLHLISEYRFDIEDGNEGLFMADSTGKMTIYGLPRDGFFIMVGRSSPNVLSVDDLRDLSSGRVPEFNDHSSVITIHLPLSSDNIEIVVHPDGNDRITDSDYLLWDDRRVYGGICKGQGYSCELGMYDSPNSSHEDITTYRGNAGRYHDNVYYLDLWPVYPAVASISSYEDYLKNGTIPVYAFSVGVDCADLWPMGLCDEPYIISDGNSFYLTGRQALVSREINESQSFGNTDMVFSAFASNTGCHSTRKLILKFDDLETVCGRTLLMSMLETLKDNGCIHASLYFQQSTDSEPEFLTDCSLRLDPPTFLITDSDPASSRMDIDGAVISFDETGNAMLEMQGECLHQLDLSDNPKLLDGQINGNNSVMFEDPENDSCVLLMYIPDFRYFPDYRNIPSHLMSELIASMPRSSSISGTLYEVNLENGERTEIADFRMNRRHDPDHLQVLPDQLSINGVFSQILMMIRGSP